MAEILKKVATYVIFVVIAIIALFVYGAIAGRVSISSAVGSLIEDQLQMEIDYIQGSRVDGIYKSLNGSWWVVLKDAAPRLPADKGFSGGRQGVPDRPFGFDAAKTLGARSSSYYEYEADLSWPGFCSVTCDVTLIMAEGEKHVFVQIWK